MAELEKASRGRKRPRDEQNEQRGSSRSDTATKDDNSALAARTTHVSRTDSEKRYVCEHPGCGKSYSRAEHLNRHQLNHDPKEIYHCDFPGCVRTFVRQDLCTRHRDRHTSQPLQLPENKTSDLEQTSDLTLTADFADPQQNAANISKLASGSHSAKGHNTEPQITSHARQVSGSSASESNGEGQYRFSPSDSRFQQLIPHSPTQMSQLASMVASNASSGNDAEAFMKNNVRTSITAYSPRQNFLPTASSPLPGSSARDIAKNTGLRYLDSNQSAFESSEVMGRLNQTVYPATTSKDRTNISFSIPNSDGQSLYRSPGTIGNEFTTWLFNDGALQSNIFPMGQQPSIGMLNYADDFTGNIYANYFADPALDDVYPDFIEDIPMTFGNVVDLSPDTSMLSQSKRRSLIELMENCFNQSVNSASRSHKYAILGGDQDAVDHVLSMRSMQLYISSYWYHFHAQLPILHKPTFSAEKTHDYLLLAVMAVGASCLDAIHGRSFTDAATRLAEFIASNLRWQVFAHPAFHPPTQLWIFQTLLLLDIYERTCATRVLHERAHIHFATTLTLMRRGSSLIGRSGDETPASSRNMINSISDEPSHDVPDEWWNQWITAEATRRAAFAAFVLDSTYAPMFGHAAIMAVHEIRLPLPCDEALWSATSAGEVGRVQASLHANGIRQTSFLDGLKNILNARKVQTNPFGRMILVAGLLSLSWHMSQRDLQGSTLGVRSALGLPEGWRDPLTRAFDFWKRDFDDSVARMRSTTQNWQRFGISMEEENAAEAAGTVLHHLSHMSMHVDIKYCQIYAGVKSLLGRAVTRADRERVKMKMSQWVKTSGARDAVFHALKFLKQLLVPSNEEQDDTSTCKYTAREDFLLNRPWVVYFSALVVWSYGFASEGPLQPFPYYLEISTSSEEELLLPISPRQEMERRRAIFRDAKSFLGTVGAVNVPDDLERLRGGRNRVVGLIEVVRGSFEGSRWELLVEASQKLYGAINLLKGGGEGDMR